MFSFDLFESRKSIHLATIRDARLEIGGWNMEHRTSGENHCPFNSIVVFADVSRPGIPGQCVHGFRRNCVYLLLHVSSKVLGEVPDQKGNVFRAFPYGRTPDWKTVHFETQIS